MSYPKLIVNAARNQLAGIRTQNKLTLLARQEEIAKKIPRIAEIDYELSRIGLSITNAIMNGMDVDKEIKDLEAHNLSLKMEKCELLVEHGYPSNYLSEIYKCKICHDEGYSGNVMCECLSNLLKQEAYKNANLPIIMDTQCFDTFCLDYYPDNKTNGGFSPREAMQNIVEYCKSFVKEFDQSKENLLFYGGTGLGKTFLSSCIAKEILEKGRSVFYQTAFKIFSILEEMKFSSNKNKDIAAAQAEVINQSDLLIIDDLGTEFLTSYTSTTLFDLINTRLLNCKKTIISTNLSMDDLTNIYSPRVTSRLLGDYTKLKFYGNDIRVEKNL